MYWIEEDSFSKDMIKYGINEKELKKQYLEDFEHTDPTFPLEFYHGVLEFILKTIQPKKLIYYGGEKTIELIVTWFAQDVFKAYRQIYIINSHLYKELIETSKTTKIDTQSFNQLPFQCFYVDTTQCDVFLNNIKILGFLANDAHILKANFSTHRLEIVLHLNNDFSFVVPLDISVDTLCLNEEDIIKCINPENLPEIIKNDFQNFIKVITNFVLILLYMSSANSDIKKVKVNNSKKKKKTTNKNRKEPTINRVGYKIGAILTKTKIQYEQDLVNYNAKGTKKSPHFRKAHFSTYYVGHGDDKKPILKWISAIYVNANNKDDDITTLHKVI